MALSRTSKAFLICLVLATLMSQEVDARRKILKGRRAITRTYLRDSAIPAWAVVVLVGVGEIIAGVILFFVMKKVVIDPPIVGSYTPAHTEDA